jgi:hypothetical protein
MPTALALRILRGKLPRELQGLEAMPELPCVHREDRAQVGRSRDAKMCLKEFLLVVATTMNDTHLISKAIVSVGLLAIMCKHKLAPKEIDMFQMARYR